VNLKEHIGEIPDFPRPGILFYDISPLLADARAWRHTVERLAELIAPYNAGAIAGIESRGFLVGAPLALELGLSFIMVRKQGKLPGKTTALTYALEYGEDTVEVQTDCIQPGQKVVVLDDLLATGGTMAAAIALLDSLGASVAGAASIIELNFLNGRSRLPVPFDTLISYDE
jgi:adenine phosphoribosyltransferase